MKKKFVAIIITVMTAVTLVSCAPSGGATPAPSAGGHSQEQQGNEKQDDAPETTGEKTEWYQAVESSARA